VPLRHVLSRGDANRGYLLFREIVGDRQRLEGGERANNAMDIIFLDSFLRLGACSRRSAGRVRNNQLDLAARKRCFRVPSETSSSKFHVDAAGGQRSGFGGQQTDPDRSAILGKDEIGAAILAIPAPATLETNCRSR